MKKLEVRKTKMKKTNTMRWEIESTEETKKLIKTDKTENFIKSRIIISIIKDKINKLRHKECEIRTILTN